MLKIIISMVLCVVSSIVHADVLKNLDSFLQNASITANFTQTVYGNKKNRISQGTMQIDRPNKFRWEYLEDGQLIVSDGKNMYIYDKPLQQVTEKKLNNSLGLSPALLLAGGTDVKKYYTIKVSPESGNLEWVNLQPKNINDNNGFKTIDIGFNKTSHLLSQMKFIDSFDNKSEISFTNLRTDIKAPASTFTFVPPKGVDIIKSDN